MRVISIIGHSNSGKTTLIKKLVPELTKFGRVGCVKHAGHHIFALPKGKDTTIHFEAGADCGAGIDAEKTCFTLRGTDLYTVLDFYAFMGFDYAVVEGFKKSGFACVSLGDLKTNRDLLHNPGVEEIVEARDLFDEYVQRRYT